ncbi:MAG: hypothetical protein GKS03_03345 [Alphaproteobacteria bacterium]|nr:hypothetical protein [Alphaproteobacteria bacterium]
MFNLLVAYSESAWSGEPYTYSLSRVFEYTKDSIADQFRSFDDVAVEKLMSLPSLFAHEEGVGLDAQVGQIVGVQQRSNEVRVKYEIDSNLPKISLDELSRLVWELDIGNMEMYRTHWALKDADLFSVLIDAGVITQSVLKNVMLSSTLDATPQESVEAVPIKPSVFRIPDTGQEPDLVSVMMPFHPDFDEVYSTLQKACVKIGLRCMNANEIWEANEIIQDIFSLIYRSKIVVCDFSNKNPNVFYEAGIAHTLGRSVIPIVQNTDHVPFDLKHYRHILYLNNEQGRTDLEEVIEARLRFLTSRN